MTWVANLAIAHHGIVRWYHDGAASGRGASDSEDAKLTAAGPSAVEAGSLQFQQAGYRRPGAVQMKQWVAPVSRSRVTRREPVLVRGP